MEGTWRGAYGRHRRRRVTDAVAVGASPVFLCAGDVGDLRRGSRDDVVEQEQKFQSPENDSVERPEAELQSGREAVDGDDQSLQEKPIDDDDDLFVTDSSGFDPFDHNCTGKRYIDSIFDQN